VSAAAADLVGGWRTVEVGGVAHSLRWDGFEGGLALALDGIGVVTLPCWRYRDHLAALRPALIVKCSAIDLDLPHYLADMLAQTTTNPPLPSPLSEAQMAALLPVALWWAGGADAPILPSTDAEGWRRVGDRRARLRPWTERTRLAAMLSCLHPDDADQDSDLSRFDAVAYLDAMVRASVVAIEPLIDIDELAAPLAMPLINAVVVLNVVAPEAEPLPGNSAAAHVAALRTLRLCRAMGWTPSQVWAAPAAEIDRLLALLDAVDAPLALPAAAPATALAAAPGTRRRLADLPDAVLIRIDD
jgi:hypothetical protein